MDRILKLVNHFYCTYVCAGEPCDAMDTVAAIIGEHVFKDVIINVTRGDYAPLMLTVVENLTKAKVNKNSL